MTLSNTLIRKNSLQADVLKQAEADDANLLFIVDAVNFEFTIAFPKMKREGDVQFYGMDINDEMVAYMLESQDAMLNAACFVANETIEKLDLEPMEITKICGAKFEPMPDEPEVDGISTGVVSIFSGDVLKADGTIH